MFKELLLRNNCQLENILPEWTVLKSYMMPIIKNNLKAKYLDIWKIIFNDDNIIKECRSALDIFEIILICPFSNAKLGRMFSRMNRIKTNWRNRLSREGLLRIGEDGPQVKDFSPDIYIDSWFNSKVRQLNSGPHKYPEKRQKAQNQDGEQSVVDLSTLNVSDLEDNDSDLDELC